MTPAKAVVSDTGLVERTVEILQSRPDIVAAFPAQDDAGEALCEWTDRMLWPAVNAATGGALEQACPLGDRYGRARWSGLVGEALGLLGTIGSGR